MFHDVPADTSISRGHRWFRLPAAACVLIALAVACHEPRRGLTALVGVCLIACDDFKCNVISNWMDDMKLDSMTLQRSGI